MRSGGSACDDEAVDLIALMLAFAVAVLLISASPGPAMALILRRAAVHGWRAAVPTVLGLEFGLYLWALMAAAGFAALVAVSEAAFVTLKVVGAAVLIYLGVRAWLAAWRGAGRHRQPPRAAPARGGRASPRESWSSSPTRRPRSSWSRSTRSSCPIALLFTTTAGLALVQVTIETAFYLSLAYAFGRAGRFFRSSRVALDAIAGTVLVELSLTLRLVGALATGPVGQRDLRARHPGRARCAP